MRILWQSAPPYTMTGYGRCTREIACRLHGDGHEVLMQPISGFSETLTWHGEEMELELNEPMKILESQDPFGLGNSLENFKEYDCDFYFTHFDTWMNVASENIPDMGIPYGSYIILDHDPVPKKVTNQIMNASRTFTMSKWAKYKLDQKGVRTTFIPHGVNTDVYRPINWEQEDKAPTITCKIGDGRTREVDVQDTFIVGMVAANQGDRKRIPIQMEAFKQFVDNVDEDAIMYIHTDAVAQHGHNLENVRKEIGLDQRNVLFADPEAYHNIGDEDMNIWYNAFDILLNCSQGESWGLTLTESMAAGTPVIATNFSSMPEQLGVDPENGTSVLNDDLEPISSNGTSNMMVKEAPHGLVVDPSVGIWRERVASKQMVVSPDNVYEALKYYYHRDSLRERHSKKAREHVVENYDWEDVVVPKWKKQFDQLEQLIT